MRRLVLALPAILVLLGLGWYAAAPDSESETSPADLDGSSTTPDSAGAPSTATPSTAPTTTRPASTTAASVAATPSTPVPTTATPEPEGPPPCPDGPRPIDWRQRPMATPDALLDLSAQVFPCADFVVLLAEEATSLYAEASRTALAVRAPLLVYRDDILEAALLAEVERLGAGRVRIYARTEPTGVAELVDAHVILDATERTELAAARNLELQLRAFDGSAEPGVGGRPTLVVNPEDALHAMLALPILDAGGLSVVVARPEIPESLARLRPVGEGGGEVRVVSDFDPTDRWRLDLALVGTELPGGGVEIFPTRRIVAFYGSPLTAGLGVLGEQDPIETLERMEPILESYVTSEYPLVVPAFELIATTAAASPTVDGDYSRELDIEDLEPWVDVATDHGAFVVLDIQPGRDDFLSQAQRYESLLRRPNVGLALDPEWRLGPTELPLQRVGSVDSAEVNTVVQWLAELVREHSLPQKMLVLHQFQRRMLPDRELIETPPELAVVVHMDGQGRLATKYGTWNSLQGQERAPDQVLWWGWKNFYDEDFPTASPELVNEVRPIPLVVTYQ